MVHYSSHFCYKCNLSIFSSVITWLHGETFCIFVIVLYCSKFKCFPYLCIFVTLLDGENAEIRVIKMRQLWSSYFLLNFLCLNLYVCNMRNDCHVSQMWERKGSWCVWEALCMSPGPWGRSSCRHKLGLQPWNSYQGKSDGRRGGLKKHECYATAVYLPF